MITNLIAKIENLFEPEMVLEHFSFLREKATFELENNHLLLENLGYYGNAAADWPLFFSRLAPFFEFGLLFSENKIQMALYNGQSHNCAESKMTMTLPRSTPFNIYQTKAHDFLKKMKLEPYFEVTKLTCHFVRINEQTALVLFSKKAEPWNRLLLESLQKTLINYSL